MEKEPNKCQKVFNRHYVVAFWVTLSVGVGLLVTGFFMPPMAVIDGSILKAVGELMFWPAIAFGVKAVEDGRVAKLNFGQSSIHIGEDKDNNGFDDNWEKEQENDA
ncbi:MAG: hypothetical protein II453_17630 [Alphaproteobacteria bacterium]|nr:hypothetical protein [Alphaproteobacteria bacterium]